MKISWVVLTYNRADFVKQAMSHNFKNMGGYHDVELIWVDNGSTDGVHAVMRDFNPSISVLHRENLGVAKGYNRGFALATGDYIVVTGCDMLMSPRWLDTFVQYVEKIPTTGIACMYHRRLHEVPERMRKGNAWKKEKRAGLDIIHAMPIERRIFKRDLLGKIGFLREDFGLYGWEDVEWGYRAERVCDELGLLYYVIPDMHPYHLGTEGMNAHDGNDDKEYHAFKQREARDIKKLELMEQCRAKNWPYYNPFPMPMNVTDLPK